MSCFVELPPEPSPDVFGKALLECRADAAPANRLLQSSIDFLERNVRITRRGIRTQGGRAGGTRVGLVLRASHVSRPGSHQIGRFLGGPNTYRTPLGSPVPHRSIPDAAPAPLTTARRRYGNPESTLRGCGRLMTFDSRKVAVAGEDRHRASPRQSVGRKRGTASRRRDAAYPSGSDIDHLASGSPPRAGHARVAELPLGDIDGLASGCPLRQENRCGGTRVSNQGEAPSPPARRNALDGAKRSSTCPGPRPLVT